MSGPVPNGPCSNDVDAEEVPCRPFLLFVHDDDDDEPPLLTKEIDFVETTEPSSQPSLTPSESAQPSSGPSFVPSGQPSSMPSDLPSTSGEPSSQPSLTPLSPTVNGESSSGNEAVGTGSNASGSTTSYVTTTDDNLVVEEEDSSSASTPVTVAVEETTQTLYTSADASNPKPDDAIKVLLRFDYDLTTASNFNGDTLSILEDSIASDLAQIYGLIAVSTSRRVTKRRRYLRKLTVDDVMALDSQPVDVNVANTCEYALGCRCGSFFGYVPLTKHSVTRPVITLIFTPDECQDQIDPNFTCTPISGFMTAYLGPESDEEASKTAILSSVEQGMELGTYEDNEIIKVTYIGTRSNRDDMTSTELRLKQQTSLSNELALAIGLSAFFLVFAAFVSFIALNNREKKKRRSSDNSMGASAEMS
eukprot:scaffold12919_cov190-Skeletonema_marinoi.AAC.1